MCETPKIKTTVKIENCKFDIYAYKKLNNAEVKFALKQWLKQTKRTTLPKSGHYKIISILGFDLE